ncbi:MAG: hypothetical protein QOJ18_17 [Microbacteriaceae bacterium]|jgi:hypothetical protein|nr:hypothetical protein [Microbacteriaceae bacterium]
MDRLSGSLIAAGNPHDPKDLMTTSSARDNDPATSAGSAMMLRGGLEAGYHLHPIQRLAAIATASQWRDAIVVDTTASGTITVYDLAADSTRTLWHFADLTSVVPVGEPVSVHEEYGVLAIGEHYLSVSIG